MIIGKAEVNMQELEKRARNIDSFLEYCDSLVPIEFRHQRAIVDNQRYLCCMLLRKSNCVSWDLKKDILNRVLSEVRIVGFTDMLIEVNTLFGMTNKSKIKKYMEKGI